MRRRSLRLLLILRWRNEAWIALTGRISHDATEEVAGTMANGGRLRL